jgi:hypothetical protein
MASSVWSAETTPDAWKDADLDRLGAASGETHVRLAYDRRRRQREGAEQYRSHATISIALDRYGHSG